MSVLLSCFNKDSKTYGPMMEFENKDLAYAKIRRQLRDQYIKGETTLDSLKDGVLVYVGEFSTVSGKLIQDTVDKIELEEFVKDLVMEND